MSSPQSQAMTPSVEVEIDLTWTDNPTHVVSAPAVHDSAASRIANARSVTAWIFFVVTSIAVFIPLNPRMPSRGFDPSYAFALNQAVARHLTFGQQILFTYGPYASIATRTYDPATDQRMMFGSAWLGLSYLAALLFLAKGRKRLYLAGLLLFLATFGPGELLLLSYPFLLSICVLKYLYSDDKSWSLQSAWAYRLAGTFLWSSLGLLPIIKGSLLVPFAVAIVLPSALLISRRRYTDAALISSVPIVTCLLGWIFAGQPLRNFLPYLNGLKMLTSGYTEAMSTSSSVLPAFVANGLVVLFLLAAGVLFISIWRSKSLARTSKLMLAVLCAAFEFVAFKHGFVIAMDSWTAFASLVVFMLIVSMLYTDRYMGWTLAACIVATSTTAVVRDPVLVQQVHDRFGVGAAWKGGSQRSDILSFCLRRSAAAYARVTYERTLNSYRSEWTGLRSRFSIRNGLRVQYERSLAAIRDSHQLSALNGSTDIYDYDQSLLLASGNAWNPRPVLQSYSAYTPDLATIDEQHLRGSNAPDSIAFELATIVGRLPSLDDGMSWPAILDNYSIVSFDGEFAYLRRKASPYQLSRYEPITTIECQTGATVSLPTLRGPVFAEVDLRPTLIGKLLNVLFAAPQLQITINLQDGTTKKYRVISEMMKTPVLLSPLVTNTEEFASFVRSPESLSAGATVDGIVITPAYGGSLYWFHSYELQLSRYIAQ
jgi:hypothetical protein